MGLSRAQIIDQDLGRAPLFYRDLRDVGFLIFYPALWGGACRTDIHVTLFGLSLPVPWEGEWGLAQCELVFPGFVLWQLSLAVFCGSSESQSSRGRILASVSEQRDRSPLSTELSWPL